MVDVAIVGASGYVGGNLMKLLSGHAKADVKVAVSNSFAGKHVSEVYPRC